MAAHSFGQHFVIHSFGESHGPAMGVVVDGCPAGVEFDQELLLKEIERRRPGQHGKNFNVGTSSRTEEDKPEILSGVYQGKTLGTPIAITVRNQDAKSQDYNQIQPRAGHADDVWLAKFAHSDPRGGGRSSGRETVSRVIAGSISKMFLKHVCPEMRIVGFVSQLGTFNLTDEEKNNFLKSNVICDDFIGRFPSIKKQEELKKYLENAKTEGQSFGGIVDIVVQNPPKNLGQPVFHKLKADLTAAMMGVGAAVAVEIGDGIEAAGALGTEFHSTSDQANKQYGGIRGGISTGEQIAMRVYMKPTSSILDVAKKGRHDPSLVIRATPVFEAMAALVFADHVLWSRKDRV